MKNPIRLVIFKSNNYKVDDEKRFMKLHQHSSLELSYIISGEIILEFYSEETKKVEKSYLFPHQFFIIKPGCLHSVNIPSSLVSLGLEFVTEEGEILDYIQKSKYVANLPLAQNILKDFQDVLIFHDNQNVALPQAYATDYNDNKKQIKATIKIEDIAGEHTYNENEYYVVPENAETVMITYSALNAEKTYTKQVWDVRAILMIQI